MAEVFTGPVLVISEREDLAALAELISRVDFSMIKESADASNTLPTITESDYQLAMTRLGNVLINAGLLNDDLLPTGRFFSRL